MRPGPARVAPGRLRVLGTGLALPAAPWPTDLLCAHLEDRFDVPARRWGRVLGPRLQVQTRHFSRPFLQGVEATMPGSRNPELAAEALRLALAQAGLSAQSLSYLITHTATPARLLPGGSAEVAALVGAGCAHVELRQACTGFANALQFAALLLREPGCGCVAVVGSDTASVYFDPRALGADRSQWVNLLQMGDGAAAVVLSADDGTPGPVIQDAYFGQMQDAPPPGLQLADGGSDRPAGRAALLTGEHDFAAVALHGAALIDAGRAVLQRRGHTLADAAWLVPHQASGATADLFAAHVGVPRARVCDQARHVGNLGSAAIWAALHDLLPRLAPGQRALFLGAEATQYSFGGFALMAAPT